eukprot:s656_g5.t1
MKFPARGVCESLFLTSQELATVHSVKERNCRSGGCFRKRNLHQNGQLSSRTPSKISSGSQVSVAVSQPTIMPTYMHTYRRALYTVWSEGDGNLLSCMTVTNKTMPLGL